MKKTIYILLTFHFVCGESLLTLNAQWLQQPSGVTTPLYNVEFVNRYTGWVTGNSSVILKTTNGGVNWFQQTIDLVYPKNLYGLDMLDANTGYIAGWFETILKTTNGGTNWQIISNIPSNQGNSNHGTSFINAQTGWICSSLGRVLRTTNGGLSWDTAYVGSIGPLRDIQFLNAQTGWVCGDGGNLVKSTNGGVNWITMPLLTTSNLLSLYFLNVSTGWTVSEQSKMVFRTTNGGSTWDTLAILPGGGVDFLYSVYFTNFQTGWIGGSNTRLFKTTNDGFNWIQQFVPTPMFVWNFSLYNDSIGWATGGNQGAIIHTTNGGTYVAVPQTGNGTPKEFRLYQNFPNPFNSSTSFEFQIFKSSNVAIKLFNVLGMEIKTLVDERVNAGVYKVHINANELSSGLYFYSLFVESKLTDSRKMVLIK